MSVTTDALRQCAAAIVAVADALDVQAVASDVLDVAQAATVAKCSARSVRAAIKAGKLAARGNGRHVVIARTDLDAWLRNLPARAVRVECEPEHDDSSEVDALADELRSAAQ